MWLLLTLTCFHATVNTVCLGPFGSTSGITTTRLPRLPMQGYDILEDMYSPKTAAANFAHELCEKKKVHLDAFMAMLARVSRAEMGARQCWQAYGNCAWCACSLQPRCSSGLQLSQCTGTRGADAARCTMISMAMHAWSLSTQSTQFASWTDYVCTRNSCQPYMDKACNHSR